MWKVFNQLGNRYNGFQTPTNRKPFKAGLNYRTEDGSDRMLPLNPIQGTARSSTLEISARPLMLSVIERRLVKLNRRIRSLPLTVL